MQTHAYHDLIIVSSTIIIVIIIRSDRSVDDQCAAARPTRMKHDIGDSNSLSAITKR